MGGGLDLDISDRSSTIRLAGELDVSTGDRLIDAVAWLRRRHPRRSIVIDTSRLSFVDVGGWRALCRAVCQPDGTRAPRVLHVVGPAVARLELVLSLAARSR